jgi:hypothetical protein
LVLELSNPAADGGEMGARRSSIIQSSAAWDNGRKAE